MNLLPIYFISSISHMFSIDSKECVISQYIEKYKKWQMSKFVYQETNSSKLHK